MFRCMFEFAILHFFALTCRFCHYILFGTKIFKKEKVDDLLFFIKSNNIKHILTNNIKVERG
jgi:hypothetical protein